MEKFRFISDPGHGWLEVQRELVRHLGIAEKVSSCSYLSAHGDFVYLEEDCDAPLFIESYTNKFGYEPNIVEEPRDGSWIRRLPMYQA